MDSFACQEEHCLESYQFTLTPKTGIDVKQKCIEIQQKIDAWDELLKSLKDFRSRSYWSLQGSPSSALPDYVYVKSTWTELEISSKMIWQKMMESAEKIIFILEKPNDAIDIEAENVNHSVYYFYHQQNTSNVVRNIMLQEMTIGFGATNRIFICRSKGGNVLGDYVSKYLRKHHNHQLYTRKGIFFDLK